MDINLTRIEINGHKLECDFMDADVLDTYEDACARLQERGAECRRKALAKMYARSSDSIRDQCDALEEFVDAIFGAGTSERVFDGVHGNLRNHEAAINKIIDATKATGKEINDMNNRMAQRTTAATKAQNAQQFRVYASTQSGGNRKKRRHKN